MTVFFNGISFIWALVALVVIVAALGLRAWFGYRHLSSEAAADWDYRVANNMQDLRLDKLGYMRAYQKVHAPRLSLYLAGGAALILLLTPFVFGLLNVLFWGVWKFSGESRVFEPGYLVWGFSIFFGLIAAWALIGAGVARHYHANHPGLMRDELMAERENFMPTKELIIGPNPVHIDGSLNANIYREMFAGVFGLTCVQDENWNQTGSICETYGNGSGMEICVHSFGTQAGFDVTSHPFFFAQKHAREEVEASRSTIIMSLENIHIAMEKIRALDITLEKTLGGPHSKTRSFVHKNLDVFLYEKP